ncbi:MAG TPA: pilus assembly protein PilM, partial [Firmicutes bacterium]|nr:pilus assembly protein PilM [Bacillota bacterium]
MSVREVFALDIGTRKIAGLIMSRTAEGFVIKHASLHQQLAGAMADGQIHHIEAVAQVIARIKRELEEKSGTVLKKTAVAAAGRSLITQTGLAAVKLTPNERISPAAVQELELKAVWAAVKKLATNGTQGVMDTYLCVGYSAIQYYLDGEPIGSLPGHQGSRAEVKVIATFLPRIVIDSLGTAIEQAGLEMSSLTLEPIAAMHIVVPATMRLLNIALVDIGAGTSDLALAAGGAIKNYGMVSYAGDAITKGIAEHFLLDLPVAEQVKINLKPNEEIECQDVFGNELTLAYSEVVAVIYPYAQRLAEKIAKEIIRLNGEAPKGIILIGGGSLTPQLASLLAESLKLPENLVRVRGRAGLKLVAGVPEFEGPEVITPIGIGCTYLDGLAMALIQVKVNGRTIQLFKGATSTIGDALLNCGYSSADLIARPGPALTVELNGRCVPIPGTLGKPAAVLKNNKPADLNTELAEGDEIKVEPALPG